MLRAERFLLACLLVFSLVLSCGDNGTEPEPNRPPNAPTNPTPANGALNQPIDVDLSWECSDPDGDALTYVIGIMGMDMHIIADSNLTQPSYDPGQLHYGTLYGWAVIPIDEHGVSLDSASIEVWTFTTVSGPPNNPPSAPSNPSPANGATNQSTLVQLSWSCTDPDGDDLTYDINFGTSSPPPLVQSNQSATTYDPGTLQSNTTYYWRIIADDGTDQTQGSIWSFSTVSSGVFLVGDYDLPSYGLSVFVEGIYAYVGDGLSGLLIINIANPSNPTLVGSYNTPSSSWEVYKSGNYAYIADSQSGLQIVNVSNPVNPLLAGNYNTTRTDGVFVLGGYVYLTDRWEYAMKIIDVSTPSSPSLTGSYSTGDECRKVQVIGDYAYVANFESGLLILNVSNPSSPAFVGQINLGDQVHGLHVVGDYAYVAAYYAGLKIVNVSNPASPSLVGTYSTPEETWHVIVEGDYAYLAAGAGGFNIIDVSNPASPTLAGGYAPAGSAIYVAKDDNYIYITDGLALYILEFIQ